MNEKIKIKKKVTKKYFNLNEEVNVIILITNISNHALENVEYTLLESEYYSLIEDKIFIDTFNIKIGLKKNKINVGNLYSGEEKKIEVSLKIEKINGDNETIIKGLAEYYFYGERHSLEATTYFFSRGADLKIIGIERDKDILFGNEESTYKIQLQNAGNVVCSNVIFKYNNNGNLRTVLGSIKVDDILIEDGFIEEGINIGSIFEGALKNIEFKVKPKLKTVSIDEKDDTLFLTHKIISLDDTSTTDCVIEKKIKKLLIVENTIEITKKSNVEIISTDTDSKIFTTIKNNSGVDIKNFRLLEHFNGKVTISNILLDTCTPLSNKGCEITIPLIQNGKEILIEYNLNVNNENQENTLILYSEGIYNLGNDLVEKRFKKNSEKLLIDLNINTLDIQTFLEKDKIRLDEGFKRKIIINNKGIRKINRVRIFDILLKGARISKGSFMFNENRINNLDNLNEGLDLGELEPGESFKIEYLGEFLDDFEEKNLCLTCFCNYSIIGFKNKEVSSSKTNEIIDILEIDRIYHECILSKKIDIRKLGIKNILNITGNGSISDIKTLKALKEIKKEGRFVPYQNLLTKGKININVEYLSYDKERDSLFNFTTVIDFRESIECKLNETNIRNAQINIRDIKGQIKNNFLEIVLILNITIS